MGRSAVRKLGGEAVVVLVIVSRFGVTGLNCKKIENRLSQGFLGISQWLQIKRNWDIYTSCEFSNNCE